MTANPNQPKRLDWSMLLVTIVLLAFELVHGASSNCSVGVVQHVLGADQRDVQVQRQLRPNVEMTEKIAGDSEERTPVYVDYLARALHDELAKSFQATVATRYNVIRTDGLFGNHPFRMWAESVESKVSNENYKAEQIKLTNLLTLHNEETVVQMIAAGKSIPYTKVAAENLETALMLKRMAHDIFRLNRRCKHGLESSEIPLWTSWFEGKPEGSQTKICEALFNGFENLENLDENMRVELFMLAKNNAATARLGEELQKFQLDEWIREGKKGEDLFDQFELVQAGNQIAKSSLWNTWLEYMKKLEGQHEVAAAVVTLLKREIGDYGLAKLLAIGKADKATTEAIIVEFLKHNFE